MGAASHTRPLSKRRPALCGLALVLPALGLVSTASCEQASIDCRGARGDFAVRLTLVEGNGACAELKGEVVGLATYYEGDREGNQDRSRIRLAMKTQTLGLLQILGESFGAPDEDPTHAPFSIGLFGSPDPAGGVCTVPSLSPAEQAIAELAPEPPPEEPPPEPAEDECPAPEPFPGAPATRVKVTWSNVRVLVRPDAPGTQWTADLLYEQTVAGESCQARYRALAVYPAVDCAEYDECGNPTGNVIPELCSPVALPERGIEAGSGINPDFPVVCDPGLGLCVLREPAPELR